MEELIKEAESLYLELSRITDSLVYARLHDDNDLLHGCRNELENFAQSVMQTLKCLVDRKDNIVDLGEVWHDITEPADRNGHVLLSNHPKYIEMASQGQKIWGESICKRAKYAYLKDLLPKGGEA